ncbi:ATP-grasp domain-containing protein [Nonomuraea sp. B19D2]|uniref:ATP-grasp domain-containing protein n=1 Tax=Nonomuraea sp. B19D2 TaxID=3159561 RepID=UPI0032DBC411
MSQRRFSHGRKKACLPGPGVGAARIARSKIRQREVCQRHGLTGPRHSAVTGPDDLVRFFATGVQAAVLKPADSSASAAVFAVHGVEEALDRWPRVRAISPSRTGIVEEYLSGAEASVEAVVRDGKLIFSSLTRKQTGGPTGFLEVAHTTDRADRPNAALNALVRDLIAAWQVESAVLHVEVKLDGGRPVLLEATVRPAGDYITELVSAVHGRDLYLDQARLALGQPLAVDRPASARRAEVRFLLASGIVRRNVAPVEVLAGLTDVKIVRQLAAAGCRLPPLTANWARAGYALGWSTDDGDSLTRQLRTAVSELGKLMGASEIA